MLHTSKSLILGTLVAVAASSVALAAEPAKRSASAPQRQDAAAAGSATRPAIANALGGASSSSARLVALIDQGGGVIRSKGVARVTRPGTGRYCIQPRSDANIRVNTIVPVVSVDYSNSTVHESMVQYRSSGDGCPGGTIAVVTFADVDLDGIWGFSSSVAFTIVVD